MGIYGPRTIYCIALKDAPGCHEFVLQDDGKWMHIKETTEIGWWHCLLWLTQNCPIEILALSIPLLAKYILQVSAIACQWPYFCWSWDLEFSHRSGGMQVRARCSRPATCARRLTTPTTSA